MVFVYILRCADDTYYVGMTSDLKSRVELHNAGLAVQYTALRRPVVLIHSEAFDTNAAARGRERQLKRWSGKKKAALAAEGLPNVETFKQTQEVAGRANAKAASSQLRATVGRPFDSASAFWGVRLLPSGAGGRSRTKSQRNRRDRRFLDRARSDRAGGCGPQK